jgi:nucleoside 2-deoxyribosyltransferase
MRYYAHSIYKYNTPIEQYELSLVPGKVINPNGIVDQTKTEEEIMKDCYKLIDKCDSLVFSSVDGVIGKGVADEIVYAFIRNKTVYYIHNNRLNKIKSIVINPIENSKTRRIYATFDYEVE